VLVDAALALDRARAGAAQQAAAVGRLGASSRRGLTGSHSQRSLAHAGAATGAATGAAGGSPAAAAAAAASSSSASSSSAPPVRVDAIVRRLATLPDVSVPLAGMETWGFDIIAANSRLLGALGYLPAPAEGGPAAAAAPAAATGGAAAAAGACAAPPQPPASPVRAPRPLLLQAESQSGSTVGGGSSSSDGGCSTASAGEGAGTAPSTPRPGIELAHAAAAAAGAAGAAAAVAGGSPSSAGGRAGRAGASAALSSPQQQAQQLQASAAAAAGLETPVSAVVKTVESAAAPGSLASPAAPGASGFSPQALLSLPAGGRPADSASSNSGSGSSVPMLSPTASAPLSPALLPSLAGDGSAPTPLSPELRPAAAPLPLAAAAAASPRAAAGPAAAAAAAAASSSVGAARFPVNSAPAVVAPSSAPLAGSGGAAAASRVPVASAPATAAAAGAAAQAPGAPATATAAAAAPALSLARVFTDIPDSGHGLGSEMLVALASTALEATGVVEELGLEREAISAFLARIARGYHAQPYHNALHGADVCQAIFYLLTTGGLGHHLSAEYRFAILLAAAVHDVGHPGFNNIFLSQTNHPLALTYNDRSPLENMHAATAFLTMRKPGCDVLAPLSKEQAAGIRGIVIDMVLATDNAHHFKLVGKLRRRLARAMRRNSAGPGSGVGASGGAKVAEDDDDYTSSDDGGEGGGHVVGDAVTHPLDMGKVSDARLVLITALHACDISNPGRGWEVYGSWTDRITEEFLIQGAWRGLLASHHIM
jgi:hypothetical protein